MEFSKTGTGSSGMNKKGRILVQNRPEALTQPGGDTLVMNHLVRGLSQLGYEVVVDLEGKQSPGNFDLVQLFNFATPAITKSLASKAKEHNVPYVVVSLYEDIPNFRSQGQRSAQLLMEYVRNGQNANWFSSQDWNMHSLPKTGRFDNSWVAENAAALIACGDTEAKVLRHDYPNSGKICVTSFGANLTQTASPADFEREYGVSNFVLCVGRFEWRKNQLMLLKALENSDLTLVLASGGFSYDAEYDAAVRSFRRKGKTIIAERLTDSMLASAYAACKCHVLPSWYELPGLVSLEAAMYGKNVVATKYGAAPDYLGQFAYYCKPNDPESILNAVTAAYFAPVNPELRSRVQSFTWESFASQMDQIYAEILPKQVQPSVEASNTISAAQVFGAGFNAPTADNSTTNTDPQIVLEEGERAAKNREYDRAHQLLEQAAKLGLNSVRLQRARGAVYLAQQDYNQAKPYFEQALKQAPADFKALSGLGMCEIMSGNHQQAYDFFVRSLTISPEQLVTIHQLLQCSYALSRFDDLERVLRAFVMRHTDDLSMQYCLAGCLYKQNKIAEAKTVLSHILSIDPNNSAARQLQGVIDESQTVEVTPEPRAETPIQMSSPTEPTFNNSNMNIIAELEEAKRQRRLGDVIAGANKVINDHGASASDKEVASLLKAEAMAQELDLVEAQRIFEEVERRNPNNARATSGKGAILAHQGNWEEAKACFERALQVQPNYDTALAGLALYHSQVDKDSEKAWDLYDRALGMNPENSRALYGMLELAYPLKRLDVLEKKLESYLDMHPADLNFMYAMAGCMYAQDKISGALTMIERILVLDTSHSRALELKQIIFDRLGSAQAMARP